MQRFIGLKVLSSFQFPTKIICYDIAITKILQDKVYCTISTFYIKKETEKDGRPKIEI